MGTNSLQTSTPTGEKTQQQESQPCCRLACCSCDSAVPDEPTWGDRTCLIVHYFRKVQAKPTRWLALSFSAAHVVPSLGHSPAEHWRCGPGQRCLALPKNRLWFKTGHTCHAKRNLPPTWLHLRESHLHNQSWRKPSVPAEDGGSKHLHHCMKSHKSQATSIWKLAFDPRLGL